jgi:hypothetical protein
VRLACIFVLLLASVLPVWAATQHPRLLGDDTLITLTFAKNLAAGRGFVFNHPPAVLGTTTPLTVLLVAGAHRLLQVDLPTLAIALSCFAWLAIPWTLFFYARAWQLEEWQALVLGLFVLVAPGWLSTLGMEAYLFAWLLLLCLSLFFAGWIFSAGVCAGLLFLTRGEGALAVVVLALAQVLSARNAGTLREKATLASLARLGLGFAIPLSLWALYALPTFDVLLPSTLAGKRAQGESGLWATLPYRLWFQWMPRWGGPLAVGGDAPFNLWWTLVALGLATTLRLRRRWAALLAWAALYVLGYTLLGVGAMGWYQHPVLLTATLMAGLGLVELLTWGRRLPLSAPVKLVAAVAVVAVVTGASAAPTIRRIRQPRPVPYAENYARLGHWFREHTPVGASVAYLEIGYLGFYSDNKIIDLAGLLDREVAAHVAVGDFAWAFWQAQPDYYVYAPDFGLALARISQNPRFSREYRPLVRMPGKSEHELVIFQRVPGR